MECATRRRFAGSPLLSEGYRGGSLAGFGIRFQRVNIFLFR